MFDNKISCEIFRNRDDANFTIVIFPSSDVFKINNEFACCAFSITATSVNRREMPA